MEKQINTIYFIGIKGVGMTALAVFAKEMGFSVSGSDDAGDYVTSKILEKAGIPIYEFDVKNLKAKPDLVVVSAAYDKDHIEVREAIKRHFEVKSYSEALANLTKDQRMIAVAGIHGKTTTTSLISYLLTKANLDPSFIIGSGEVPSLVNSSHFGKGEYIIVEADEYKKSAEEATSKFLDFSPKIEVITSIEMDHPDFFHSLNEVYNAFYKFACRVPRNGFIVLCHDYPWARKIETSLADRQFETYGFDSGAKWQVIDFKEDGNETSFYLEKDGEKIGPFELKIPGRGNVLNATSAIIVAVKLGVSIKAIQKYLPSFSGVKRRFEIIGEEKNITVIDDYAHHPHAISLTLEAIKRKYADAKIWCIFQPHTYSRTKELLGDFAKCFELADRIIITDIYASARESEMTISGQDLANEIKKYKNSVKYISDWRAIENEIIDNISGRSVVVVLGAGDIYKLAQEIYKDIKNGG